MRRFLILACTSLLVACTATPRAERLEASQARPSLGETQRIRVAVCEYMVTKLLGSPTNTPICVDLSLTETQALRDRLPAYCIRAPGEFTLRRGVAKEKGTGREGPYLRAGIVGWEGGVPLAVGSLGAFMSWDIHLRKDRDWIVTGAHLSTVQ